MIFEKLNKLKPGDLITIDDINAINLTESEDHKIREIKHYTQEEGELIIVDLDGFYLVDHTLTGKIQYYVCEFILRGTPEDVEAGGFSGCGEESFPEKIINGSKRQRLIYRPVVDPVYDLASDREESSISICQYRTKSKTVPYLLVIADQDETTIEIIQGIRIKENSILL